MSSDEPAPSASPRAALQQPAPPLRRRSVLAAAAGLAGAPLLAACASPLPAGGSERASPAARSRLEQSARAHGLAAWRALQDVNVAFDGEWRALIGRLQPALVDAGFRQLSEERLMPALGLTGQAHFGPDGRKQVVRRAAAPPDLPRGEVRVWFNGEEARDAERREAAALVADGYALFLLGPIAVMQRLEAGRPVPMALDGVQSVGGHACDGLQLRLSPGLGLSAMDRLTMFIDREEGLMRRVRFSLEGFGPTQGAIAEVDTFDFVERHGLQWPTRFYERLLRPIPYLPVHDFRLTGLDVNRGYAASAIDGPAFTGAAAAPATPLPPRDPARSPT
jgi:hypothetical protein